MASGCSSGGTFILKKNNPTIYRFHFQFDSPVNMLCLPGKPFCDFAVTVTKSSNRFRVNGAIDCDCAYEHTEVRDVLWEDAEANANYSTTIQSLNVQEYEHSISFN